MPTIAEWRSYYDGWVGRDPRVASTGETTADADFDRLGDTIAGWLRLDGRERALDVGCASGTLTARWASRAANACAVDFSARLAAEAQRRHRGNVAFASAEAAELPFADATFDRVVCFNVLLSLPDHAYAERAIRELLRVAKPAARVVLGSLPDERRQQRFFEVLRADQGWPRRVWGRTKYWLRGGRERTTSILWFDVAALARRFANDGWSVEVHDDPPFANYRHYRRTIVLARGERPEP